MRNVKVTLEYDGTRYYGFQYQPGLPTVQGALEEAWSSVLQEAVRVVPAGRTDTGVHAEGQVVNFFTASSIRTEVLPSALNSALPPDIGVVSAEEVPLSFSARFSARLRQYEYRLAEGHRAAPRKRKFVAYFSQKPEAEALKQACGVFEGKHNFFAFCGGGVAVEEAWKTVHRTHALERDGIVMLRFEAPSFLPKMVRMMVAAAVQMATGALLPGRVKALLDGASEKYAKVAPPQGLSLVGVVYEG